MKLFLPQIEEANKQLEEEIRRSGKNDRQIDTDLLTEGTEDKGSAEDTGSKDGRTDDADTTVKIEFALGDFDDTPIAAIEDAQEDDDNGEGGHDDEETPDIQVLRTPK